MTLIDLISLERQRYLASPRGRQDWMRYLAAVERLRQHHDSGDSRPAR